MCMASLDSWLLLGIVSERHWKREVVKNSRTILAPFALKLELWFFLAVSALLYKDSAFLPPPFQSSSGSRLLVIITYYSVPL